MILISFADASPPRSLAAWERGGATARGLFRRVLGGAILRRALVACLDRALVLGCENDLRLAFLAALALVDGDAPPEVIGGSTDEVDSARRFLVRDLDSEERTAPDVVTLVVSLVAGQLLSGTAEESDERVVLRVDARADRSFLLDCIGEESEGG